MDKSDIKAQEMTLNVRREIAIMKALKHRNIVNLRQVLTSQSKLYIVMDLVTGGELFTKILKEGKIPENTARHYFQQLVDGIEYCHRRGVCHRDLKPENLLIDETTGELKITDFGLSAMKGASTTEELLHTQCGSPNYCAPEIIARHKQGYNGAKVDAWSCGIILFALLAGYLPFYDENTKVLYRMIQRDDVKFPKKFPSDAKDLILRLLHKDPEERYTLPDVKRHPWFLVGYTGGDPPLSSTSNASPPTTGRRKRHGRHARKSSVDHAPRSRDFAPRKGSDKSDDAVAHSSAPTPPAIGPGHPAPPAVIGVTTPRFKSSSQRPPTPTNPPTLLPSLKATLLSTPPAIAPPHVQPPPPPPPVPPPPPPSAFAPNVPPPTSTPAIVSNEPLKSVHMSVAARSGTPRTSNDAIPSRELLEQSGTNGLKSIIDGNHISQFSAPKLHANARSNVSAVPPPPIPPPPPPSNIPVHSTPSGALSTSDSPRTSNHLSSVQVHVQMENSLDRGTISSSNTSRKKWEIPPPPPYAPAAPISTRFGQGDTNGSNDALQDHSNQLRVPNTELEKVDKVSSVDDTESDGKPASLVERRMQMYDNLAKDSDSASGFAIQKDDIADEYDDPVSLPSSRFADRSVEMKTSRSTADNRTTRDLEQVEGNTSPIKVNDLLLSSDKGNSMSNGEDGLTEEDHDDGISKNFQEDLDVIPVKERLAAAVARYRRIFRLGGKIGITASPSFTASKGASGTGEGGGEMGRSASRRTDFFSRAKAVTGAWGIILCQELEEDSDSEDERPVVTEAELNAFSRLLDFWDNRRASANVTSGSEVILDDEESSPLSDEDIGNIQSLLHKLEPKPVEDEVTEVEEDGQSSNAKQDSRTVDQQKEDSLGDLRVDTVSISEIHKSNGLKTSGVENSSEPERHMQFKGNFVTVGKDDMGNTIVKRNHSGSNSKDLVKHSNVASSVAPPPPPPPPPPPFSNERRTTAMSAPPPPPPVSTAPTTKSGSSQRPSGEASADGALEKELGLRAKKQWANEDGSQGKKSNSGDGSVQMDGDQRLVVTPSTVRDPFRPRGPPVYPGGKSGSDLSEPDIGSTGPRVRIDLNADVYKTWDGDSVIRNKDSLVSGPKRKSSVSGSDLDGDGRKTLIRESGRMHSGASGVSDGSSGGKKRGHVRTPSRDEHATRGLFAFNMFTRRKSFAVTSFQSELGPEDCLLEIGKILVAMGCTVMMKKGENKMKCEAPIKQETLKISITCSHEENVSTVHLKKGRRDKSQVDAKEFYDFFQVVHHRFHERVESVDPRD